MPAPVVSEIDARTRIGAIAVRVCAELAPDSAARGRDPLTLPGECLEASCRLREALQAVGVAARVRCGMFRVDRPDPARCLCQGRLEGRHQQCFLWGHAWVECAEMIIDLTATQFEHMLESSADGDDMMSPVEMVALGSAAASRWIAD